MASVLTATQKEHRHKTLVERYQVAMDQLIENERIRLRDASGAASIAERLDAYQKRVSSLQDTIGAGWGARRQKVELAALLREIESFHATGQVE